jgi:3,4-dihydroxy 2-butanone 4-phosphate synthase/GTP cyclohydrolase II
MADPLEDFEGRAARHFARTGRPLVTLTYAQSLDGSIAARRDRRLVLSGDESTAMTHRLRAAHSAILVGIGTVLADDPRLTARLAGGPDPQPVVVDSRLRCPPGARLMQNPDRKPWILTTDRADPRCRVALEKAGAQISEVSVTPDRGIDLAAGVALLGRKGVTSLMVEGGARIITSFLEARLANWLVITIAPVFVGGLRAIEMPEGEVWSLPHLDRVQSVQLGRDVIVWGDLKDGAA